MFDSSLPYWLRALSWFHFAMIGAVIYMLLRQGYDSRALVPQTVLAMAVLVLTHLWGIKEDNPNMIWRFRPGDRTAAVFRVAARSAVWLRHPAHTCC